MGWLLPCHWFLKWESDKLWNALWCTLLSAKFQVFFCRYRVSNLEIEGHETRLRGGVRGVCQVPRMCTDYSWRLLLLPRSNRLEQGGPVLNVPPRGGKYNAGQIVFHSCRNFVHKQTDLRRPSGAPQRTPIRKLQARGILKCKPRVDICHLAPGIISVGIWHWQQCRSPAFSALPSDTSNWYVDWVVKI